MAWRSRKQIVPHLKFHSNLIYFETSCYIYVRLSNFIGLRALTAGEKSMVKCLYFIKNAKNTARYSGKADIS
jgi:hypothetical protein